MRERQFKSLQSGLRGLVLALLLLAPCLSEAAWTLSTQSPLHQRWTGDSVAANGANSSTSLDCSPFMQLDIQVLHASHSDTSTYALDWSNDGGTTWERVTTQTTSGASGSTSISVDGMPGGLFRITVTETDANGSATLTPYVTLKKKAN